MAVPPTGMSLGSSCRKNCAIAPPSLVRGNRMASPAKATAPKRAPGSSRTRVATSPLAARCATLHVARVHALRDVEHDRDVEVGRRDAPRAAPVLRLRRGEEGEREGQDEEQPP
jgi:hypothetical protein